MWLQGTSVVSGSGRAVVVATGPRTLVAACAGAPAKRGHGGSFAAAMWRISFLFLAFIAAMVPLVICLNGYTTGKIFNRGQF